VTGKHPDLTGTWHRPVDRLVVCDGIRVTPRTGGGVRADGGWPTARLIADRNAIEVKHISAGSLAIPHDRPYSISPWKYLNWAVLFDVDDVDELGSSAPSC
jgi:hypothetical protein